MQPVAGKLGSLQENQCLALPTGSRFIQSLVGRARHYACPYPAFFTYLSKKATERAMAVVSDCERLWSSPRYV
jgi:hypothetical protein